MILADALHRKLLSRNTYYKPDKNADASSDIAQSKADILNLISSDVKKVEDLPYTLTNFSRLVLQLTIGCVYIWGILGKPLSRLIEGDFDTYKDRLGCGESASAL